MSDTDDTPRKMVSMASMEEEEVEPPPPANAVRPGHLWCESARNEGETVRSLGDTHSGQQPIRSLLKQMHSDICNRLDRQEEAINRTGKARKLSCRIHVSRKPVPMPPPPSSRVTEASSMASSLPLDSLDDTNDAPIGTFHRYSLRPRLFSTFQDYDTALWDMASAADARNSRAKFSAQKSSESKGGSGVVERRVSKLVKRPCFDMICALAVVTNSLFLGVEVEMSKEAPSGLPLPFVVLQYLYAWWFTTELAMRIIADGRHFFCSEDARKMCYRLYKIIIIVSFVDGMGDVNSMTGLRAFRIVRITRIVKVVRLMRVFRFVQAFRTLIASIADTLKSLFWALMLLVVIVYVFAVLFTQAVNESWIIPEPETSASGYHAVPVHGHLGWNQLAPDDESIEMDFASVGVQACMPVWPIGQSAMESAQNDHAAMVHSVLKNKQAHIHRIRQLFSKIGDEKTQTITFARFEEKINSPAVRAYFEVLGLDVWDAWSFFKLLDLESGGDVKIEEFGGMLPHRLRDLSFKLEFLMGCLRLRGQARAIDVGKLIHDQTWLIRNQGKFQTFVEVELRKMQEQMTWLTGITIRCVAQTPGRLKIMKGPRPSFKKSWMVPARGFPTMKENMRDTIPLISPTECFRK
eukprot:s2882_g4.t1